MASSNRDASSPVIPGSLNLTLGVEIECFHLRDIFPEEVPQFCPTTSAGRKDVYEALRRPFTATCTTCKQDFRITLTRPNLVVAQGDLEKNDPCYENWTVDEEQSLNLAYSCPRDEHLERWKHTQRTSVEVISRILNVSKSLQMGCDASENEHIHEIDYEAEIDAVVRHLQESFNANTTDARTRQIDHLHSVNRITGSKLANTTLAGFANNTLLVKNPLGSFYRNQLTQREVYNHPLSVALSRSAFAQAHGSRDLFAEYRERSPTDQYPEVRFPEMPHLEAESKRYDIPSWLNVIDGARNVDELNQLLGVEGKHLTVNLHNLVDYSPNGVDRLKEGNKKMTIEFRQHAGTLQADEITAWISVLKCLVEYAHNTPAADIDAYCRNHWADPHYITGDFLEDIGCPKKTRDHYRHFMGLSTASSYAEKIRSIEQRTMPVGSRLASVMADMIGVRANNMEPSTIEAAIADKMAHGSYGMFPKGFLKDMNVEKKVRQRITLRNTESRAASEGSTHFEKDQPAQVSEDVEMADAYYGSGDEGGSPLQNPDDGDSSDSSDSSL